MRRRTSPASRTTSKPSDGTARVAGFDVVVGLDAETHKHLEETPFHTAVLEWKLDTEGGEEAALDAGFRSLVLQIRSLMETLRGPDAG